MLSVLLWLCSGGVGSRDSLCHAPGTAPWAPGQRRSRRAAQAHPIAVPRVQVPLEVADHRRTQRGTRRTRHDARHQGSRRHVSSLASQERRRDVYPRGLLLPGGRTTLCARGPPDHGRGRCRSWGQAKHPATMPWVNEATSGVDRAHQCPIERRPSSRREQ